MTTKYFKPFGIVPYRFGDNEPAVIFDNLTQYVDLIDSLKDNISFYNKYTIISGERPDTLSYKLYGTTDYYWTFFLLNDHVRLSGWPVETYNILTEAKSKYPYRMVTTNSNIATSFPVGQIVTGVSSGTQGKIIKRNLDMGQLVIDTSVTPGAYFGQYPNSVNFDQTETISYISEQDGETFTAALVKASEQYNAVHHYEDANGVHQDLTLFAFDSPNSSWTPVTYRDRLERRNDELKEINVLKDDVVDKVVSEFNNFHRIEA
jgi:hypothetical protein|tara:strand:+ start:1600 stop:2385 length:786 start_codon:yes stop_codon:yes gene_type:complete